MSKKKIMLVSLLAFTLFWPFVPSGRTAGPADPFREVRGKLEVVSEEEKKVLQNLFVLIQETEAMEREEEQIAGEIKTTAREIEDLRAKISEEETDYQKKRDIVKQVLRNYQRAGSGSYLEIIFDARNLANFLRRINILREFTRNTKALLESLEDSARRLAEAKTALDEKLVEMKEKQERLKEALRKKLRIRDDTERVLASLQEEREYYQQHLSDLRKVWDELKRLFVDISTEFSHILEEGDLPWEDLKITYTFTSVKGTIDEKAFNKIIKGYSRLPAMEIRFHQDEVEMELPEKNLVLKGSFVIENGQILRFEAKTGTFYGMRLDPVAIPELFREGYFGINLKPVLIGRSVVRSIEVTEGNMELNIIPIFNIQ